MNNLFCWQENDLDTRDWTERCFDTIGIRNPFELRAEDLPEQPNYFTCAFRRDKLDKYVNFALLTTRISVIERVQYNYEH